MNKITSTEAIRNNMANKKYNKRLSRVTKSARQSVKKQSRLVKRKDIIGMYAEIFTIPKIPFIDYKKRNR